MIRGAITLVGQLHEASRTPVEPARGDAGVGHDPFLTRQKYELGVILDNLRWRSPAFRYSLRITMAVAVGLWLGDRLPYASHSYWILLTIVVILKPNYSLTKQRYERPADRHADRLRLISVVVLRVVTDPLALLAVLYVALVASSAFSTIKYRLHGHRRLRAGADPDQPADAGESDRGGRAADRYGDWRRDRVHLQLMLPSWEYRAIPKLVENVLQANRRYIAATRDLLLRRAQDDFALPRAAQAVHGQPARR